MNRGRVRLDRRMGDVLIEVVVLEILFRETLSLFEPSLLRHHLAGRCDFDKMVENCAIVERRFGNIELSLNSFESRLSHIRK